MNESYSSKLAKIVGDTCGSLTYIGILFTMFVITLSVFILYYHVEVLSIVSIAVGITLASFFARLTLFISYCKERNPHGMFKSLAKYLGMLSVLGVAAGVFVSVSYNVSFPNEMCYEVIIGLDDGFGEETILDCHELQRDMHKILNGVLVLYPISMIVLAIIRIKLGVSRLSQ